MSGSAARKFLNGSAIFWFSIAFIGQVIFVVFILSKYGGSAIQGQAQEVWGKELTHGFEPGMWSSNIAVTLHLFLAAVITLGGLLQLIPRIRAQYPKFHRWNGRIYITTAFVMSFSGLYLLWTTGTVGGITLRLGQSFNALVIMLCAVMVYKLARARNFVDHRRWAIRLFLVVSAVWFFRVSLMAWFGIHQAPVGLDPETFTGPFVTFLVWAQTIVPLVFVQLYFYAQEKAGNTSKYTFSIVLSMLTLLMAFGIFMATVGMWFPGLMA